MFVRIPQLREQILGKEKVVTTPVYKPELFNFLGKTREERADRLSKKIIIKKDTILNATRREIFAYIVKFWEESLLSIPFKANSFRGINLAKRPFFAPNVFNSVDTFGFYEQYRWDTFFQNQGILLGGGINLAIDQLLNFVDVFTEFKRIPNALVSSYLSHGQPPLESQAAFDILEMGGKKGDWLEKVMHMVEEDLFIEWWDYGNGKINPRQTNEIIEKYGLVTRNTPIHQYPLLASCEDGKDHNWTTIKYGSLFLPVQLNMIIYGIICNLNRYYSEKNLGNNPEKAAIYSYLQEKQTHDLRRLFWCENKKWTGFRNYSILTNEEGHILYGDLAAEVWPLYFRLATQEQAEVTKNNLKKYYKGDYGLSVTSLALRKRGSIPREPFGFWRECQWEYPNCWPPLMYIATKGLKKYGYERDALEYEYSWINHLESVFKKEGGFPEKTSYSSGLYVAKGFYGTVKGFGWTVAIYLAFLKDLVEHDML